MIPAYIFPRIRDVIFGAIFISVLFLGPRMLSIDSDLGRHLTLGEYILKKGSIPAVDILSHTLSGQPRPPYEWLSQVIFALAHRLAGLDDVILTCALVIASTFAIAYADAIRRSGNPLAALILVLLAAAASSLHWLPRPHVFTFLLLAFWLERLERISRGGEIPIWQFPLLMLLWANLHGGFLFGLLAWLAYLAGALWPRLRAKDVNYTAIERKLLVVGLLSLIASVTTPDGWGNWQAVLSNNSRYILSQTMETMPPDFSRPYIWPFGILLALSVALPILCKSRMPARHIFLLAGFAILGLVMMRNIPLFAIAAAPILGEYCQLLSERFDRWGQIERRLLEIQGQLRGAAWLIAIISGAAILFGRHYHTTHKTYTQFDAQIFPARAADWLSQNPQLGNTFNDFNWGGYLLYRLWPDQRVFLDSQTDFYGEELVREYEQIILAQPGWESPMAKYNIEWTIVPVSAPLTEILKDHGWQVLYQDSTAVILRDPGTP